MKTIYKLMGMLWVFINTNYAVDTIVLMASKGSMPYSLIRAIKTSHSTEITSDPLSIPMLGGSEGTDSGAAVDDPLTTVCGIEEGAGVSAPISIVLRDRERVPGEEGDVLPQHGRLTRKASCLDISGRAVTQTESGVTDDEGVLEGVISPLSFSIAGSELARTPSFSDSALQGREASPDFDDDEFFASEGFQSVKDLVSLAEKTALTVVVVSESSRWIPREKVTVTFTRNNTTATVVWGERFEHLKAINVEPKKDPVKYQPPLTPINQVVRRSSIMPGSRTLDSRLREAAIGALFPIRLEINPVTGEEVIKVVPRPESPLIIQVET